MVSPRLLRRFPAFTRVLERSVRSVAVTCHEQRFEAGAEIFTEGEKAENLYFITEGEVDLTFESPQGRVVVDTLMPGDLMGWSMIVDPHTFTASAVARTECRLIAIDGEDLRQLFERDPSLGFYVMKQVVQSLSHRLRACQIRLSAMHYLEQTESEMA